MSRNRDAQVLADIVGRVGARPLRAFALLVLAGWVIGCASSAGLHGRDGKHAGEIEPDDIPALSKLLVEGKLSGRIHAAVHDRGIYVFTYYRNPRDVFVFANFPLTPANPAVAQRLNQLKRHDALTIKG